MSDLKLYKVNAVHPIIGYYGGNFIVAKNKSEAIEKCRERYKHFMIREYECVSLGKITGDIIK